jgi:nitrile hydratase subunit beta
VDGIHDLGGMEGFGPVARDEPSWHEAWEARAFGLAMRAKVAGNIDAVRHSIERLHPAMYLTAGYYGRWLAALEVRCVERGLITSDEVDARAGAGRAARPVAVASIGLPGPSSSRTQVRELDQSPRFAVGDGVVVADVHPAGHTRLPRYIRGHAGTVEVVHPAFVFPDTNAHGGGEHPQHVYAVRFSAVELWGAADHSVLVDVFESYLEPS